jgi:hypothetical protein
VKLFKFLILFLLLASCSFSDPAWYRSQIGTGVGNCGPATVAMATSWATNTSVSVSRARNYIGYTNKNGATSFDELVRCLKKFNVVVYYLRPQDFSLNNIKYYLSKNGLIIILIETIFIENRTYGYKGGHYIILSGIDKGNFIVQDPLAGKPDSFYNINQVWKALSMNEAIVITR